MSLKFPYRKYPDGQARGGFFYAATVPVNIALPAKNSPRSKRFDAIIDSGASQCIFHASIGRAVGLEIEKGERVSTNSIQGPTQIYLHDISLYAPGGIVSARAGLIDQLWGIEFGGGSANNGATNELFFTAGPGNNLAGTFGRISLLQ